MDIFGIRHGVAIAACGLGLGSFPAGAAGAESLDACLDREPLTRIARVLDPQGRVVHALVTAKQDGRITRAVTIAEGATPVAEVFARAAQAPPGAEFEVDEDAVCAVVDLPEAELDAESRHGGPWIPAMLYITQ